MGDGFLIQGRIWIHYILLGILLRIGILTFLRVAMLWNGACRIDRVVDNLADFEICFMIRKELLPMLKTLVNAQGADCQMNSIWRVRPYNPTFSSLSVRPRRS